MSLTERRRDHEADLPAGSSLRPRTEKGLGYIPDLPSAQDFLFDPHAKLAERLGKRSTKMAGGRMVMPRVSRIKVPARIDLRMKDPVTGDALDAMPPVYDQGNLGSCTANAVAGAFEYEQRRERLTDYAPSRLAIYYWEREIIGTTQYDSGAYVRDGFTVVNKIGAPDEALWAYDIGRFTTRPQEGVYTNAAHHRTLTYARIPTGVQSYCKQALATGTPITFGFTVYTSFFDTPASGVVKVPDIEREHVEGGHAVVMVGYEKLRARGIYYAIVRNSWGPDWGDMGYCYFPMTWLMDEYNADDFWCVQSLQRVALARAVKRRRRSA